MAFQVGDPVMHWVYGLGRVEAIEERVIAGRKSSYYALAIGDLSVWVPADDEAKARLRAPTTKNGFKELFAILSGAGEPLPEDRQERKTWLLERLKDGRAASLCRVIRDLTTYQQVRSLNDNDQHLMRRTREALLGEWTHAFALPAEEAELKLRHLLGPEIPREAKKR